MSESQMGTMLESRDREPLSHSLEDYLEAIVDLAGGPNEPMRLMLRQSLTFRKRRFRKR